MDAENDEINKKILVLGLDNSGKTSIVLSLKGDNNLMSYYSLRPTAGIDYNEIADSNAKYFVWDLGGQAKYRDRHLEKIGDYLQDVSTVMYVIDVQDTERYGEALQYLQEIADKIGDRLEIIRLVVYLHKYDPAIEMDVDNPLHQEIQVLTDKIYAIVPSAAVFKTSIYTIFRKIAVAAPPSRFSEP